MSETVDLFLTGEPLPGFHVEQVAPALAAMLRISEERALTLLNGKATPIKRQLVHGEAGRYLQALHRAGVAAEVRTIATADGAFPSLLPAAAVAPEAPARPIPVKPPVIAPAPLPEPAQPAAVDPWAALAQTAAPLQLDLVTPEAQPSLAIESYDFAAPSLKQMAGTGAPTAAAVALPGLALVEDVEEVVCPVCDLGQPKRTLCRGCGADMPRLRLMKEGEARQAHAERLIEVRPNGPLARAPRVFEDNGTAVFAFNMQGRIGRLRYLAWQWISVLPLLGVGLLAAVTPVALLLIVPAAVLAFFIWLRTSVLRLHDFGLGGIWIVVPSLAGGAASSIYGGSTMTYALLFFGLLNLAILLMPGSSEPNEFGDPPAPNNVLLVVAAVAWVALTGGVYTFKKPQVPAGNPGQHERRDEQRSSHEPRRDERGSP